jgi:hypothetical protein
MFLYVEWGDQTHELTQLGKQSTTELHIPAPKDFRISIQNSLS